MSKMLGTRGNAIDGGMKWPLVTGILFVLIILVILNNRYQWVPWPSTTPSQKTEVISESPGAEAPPSRAPAQIGANAHPADKPVIDFSKLQPPSESQPPPGKEIPPPGAATPLVPPSPGVPEGEDSSQALRTLVEERKKTFGVKKSVDMVVRTGETLRVGKETVPLDQILDQIKKQEKNDRLPSVGASAPPDAAPTPLPSTADLRSPVVPKGQPTSYYGVYVVQPGDNLWNIHFAFLREYFVSRNIGITPESDEPHNNLSSGVGRILKYAEKMVFIFNLKTRKLTHNLDLLQPLEKIVIFNLSNLDRVLAPMGAEQIKSVRLINDELTLE